MLEEVSACIIAKNEEENLPRLLNSIRGKFFEIILVDTGSTDRTVEIAESYGCKVFHREWTGFADARNYAVEKASGKWVWHFDADSELEEDEYLKFKTFFSLLSNREIYEGFTVVYKNMSVDGTVKGFSTTVHIHKKADNIKWLGKIHERVVNLDTHTILVPNFSVKVLHYGYSMENVQRNKARRNLKLIFDELRAIQDKKSIEYPLNIFYVIQSYIVLSSIENRNKNLKRIVKYIEKFRKVSDIVPDSSIFKKHFYVYASFVYKALNELDKAIEFVEEGLKLEPDYPDLLYNKAEIFELKGETKKAVESYIAFLQSLDLIKFGSRHMITDYIVFAFGLATEKLPMLILSKGHREILVSLEERWKKEKGLYTGLLLFSCLKNENPKKAESILTKLSRLYEEDIIYNLLASFYATDEQKVFLYMSKAIELNPLNPKANLFFAEKFEKDGKLLEALQHYKNYLQSTRDMRIYKKVEEIISNLKNENS